MAATAAGQAVNAGSGRVRLTAAADRFAVGQVQARKLCGFQGVNVTWQFIAIVAIAVLPAALTPLAASATTLWARAAWRGTALAIRAVVKAGIATLLLATAAFTLAITASIAATFSATIALAFKAWATLRAVAARGWRAIARWARLTLAFATTLTRSTT